MEQIFADINTGFLQETVLTILIFIYMITSFFFGKYFYKASKWFAISTIILVIFSMLKIQVIPNYYSFNGAFLSNFYTIFLKTMVLIGAFFVLLFSKNMVIKKRNKVFDFFTLILFTTLGAICFVSSNDFITMFVSFELMCLPLYLLTTFTKTFKSKEAGIKFAITGCVASAVLLLGISYIYASMGSLNFDVIYSLLRETSITSPLFNIGCILTILGFTFSIGLVPFSGWVPDTFEGTSNNIAACLSLIPIIATFGVLSRLIIFIFQYTPMAQAFLFIIGILSIYKGLLGAIRQDNLQRFMGYSTIAQSGFITLGFCLANTYATSTSLFYLITYIFMNVGVWAAIILFHNVTKKNNISDLKGLVYSSKSFSLVWSICFLSFAGLPVTAGFLAKLYLFISIAKSSELYLIFLIFVMIVSAIGVYTYFRPIKEMFCTAQNEFFKSPKFNAPKLALYICTILTIIICLCPDKTIQICQFIAYQL